MGSKASVQLVWQVVVFCVLDKLMPSVCLFFVAVVPFVAADAHSVDKRTQDHSE